MMTDISLTLDFNGVVKHLDRKLVLSASYKLNSSPFVYKDKAIWTFKNAITFWFKFDKNFLHIKEMPQRVKADQISKGITVRISKSANFFHYRYGDRLDPRKMK